MYGGNEKKISPQSREGAKNCRGFCVQGNGNPGLRAQSRSRRRIKHKGHKGHKGHKEGTKNTKMIIPFVNGCNKKGFNIRKYFIPMEFLQFNLHIFY